ncbi:MAG: hypothetical protein ACQKBY_03185, partial [Verrucomicrobiales bacterium]
MKAHEICKNIDPALISDLFNWMRSEEKDLYKTTLATLANNRKLRPVFVQKKSIPDQITWMHNTLKLRTSDAIAEHLFQVWFMKGQKELLASFCDGMGIEHNEGTVEGDLPESLDADKLKATTDALLASHDPKLITLYLRIFNLQTPEGWDALSTLLESDERL